MAKSRFEYVKLYEASDAALPNTYLVVRVDGKGFTRFCEVHGMVKPNDVRLLSLMNKSARHVMNEFKDIMLAYGQSDEYSFVFRKSAQVYNRRGTKILSTIVSMFSTAFVYYWPLYFQPSGPPDELAHDDELKFLWPSAKEFVKLAYPPAFDSRLIVYPSQHELRDYFSWRQADCHINNLYNTCFWKLVLDSGIPPRQANEILGKTDSAAKNEMLFSQFQTNYNNIPSLVRKGTTIIRMPSPSKRELKKEAKKQAKKDLAENKQNNLQSAEMAKTSAETHEKTDGEDEAIRELRGVDIISQPFWDQHPFLCDDNY